MDFFKSILSKDPEPPVPEKPQGSEPNSPTNSHQSSPSHDQPDVDPNSSNADSSWSFGGFMKTFTTRSESVLETYRRDLEEFASGLQKETELFKEAATRAVKELPASIEVGASAAQGVIKSTTDIISHGNDTLIAPSVSELDASDVNNSSSRSLDSRPYNRFDSQLRSDQSDINTFCEEPEDLDDYNTWKVGFVLEEKSEEIESLFEENGDLERMYEKVVPNEVGQSMFWCRYFYKVHKLKLQEDVRANLVKRTISTDDEVEESREKNVALSENENKEPSKKDSTQIAKEESSRVVNAGSDNKLNLTSVDKGNVVEQSAQKVSNENVKSEGTGTVINEGLGLKSDEKADSEGKADQGESCKESDNSVVPTRTSSGEEEDLEWDEIEDPGSSDEKKVSHGGTPNKADLLKRLGVPEEDEDLSWDIEDDDEPVKTGAK